MASTNPPNNQLPCTAGTMWWEASGCKIKSFPTYVRDGSRAHHWPEVAKDQFKSLRSSWNNSKRIYQSWYGNFFNLTCFLLSVRCHFCLLFACYLSIRGPCSPGTNCIGHVMGLAFFPTIFIGVSMFMHQFGGMSLWGKLA